MNTAKDIEEAMLGLADEQQAAVLQRFFKTGPGQYGEGDRFLGVKNPQTRAVVKDVWRTTTLDEAERLAHNPWHEIRLCGILIMVEMFEKAAKGRTKDETMMRCVFETYLSLHPFINNWDLVDLSAYKIAGRYELLHPEITILDEWIRPEYSLWQRRISMVCTWIAIREKQFGRTLQRAEVLLDSDHDLLHKAAGWMLREVWKHDGQDEVDDFLEIHISKMPPTMLSYATERFPQQVRQYWQQRRRGLI